MRLPVIRKLLNCTQEELSSTLSVLDKVCDSRGIKEEELEVIGELMSNISGAIEVHSRINDGISERDALNGFMKKVTNIGR